MIKILKTIGLTIAGLLGAVILFLVILFASWYLRPNRAQVDPAIVVDSWNVTNDTLHNSNTDMLDWQGEFYLAYVSSPFHFGSSRSIMHLVHSSDLGRTWTESSTFSAGGGQDIRDPKLAVIGDRLFLYALKNTSFVAEPYLTVYSYSEDGTHWTEFQPVEGLDGWLFWRPKTQDGITFYNSAYWFEHGRAALLKSSDGIHWEMVSIIHEGGHNDETEIEFLPGGQMIATARLEYDSFGDGMFGHPDGATLITISDPPFTTWNDLLQSKVTRLDGPYLFSYAGRVFAIGRYQYNLGNGGLLCDQGSILTRKRTSLFEVREDGLAYLGDLPSDGDTSYVGLVVNGDTAYASYYTSPIDRDYAWILGMLSPSAVRIAKIDLQSLTQLAAGTRSR